VIAMRRRWWILALVLVVYTALIAEIGWIVCYFILGGEFTRLVNLNGDTLLIPFNSEEGWTAIVLPAAIVTFTQVLFLIPVFRPNLLRKQQHSIWISVIASGFAGGMLATGIFFALVEGYGLIFSIKEPLDSLARPMASQSFLWWPVVIVGWALWTPLLMIFARRHPLHRVPDRVVGILFGGTILELLVVTPIDIMLRRKTSCWCGTGTAMGYCLAVCATLWLAGPGIIVVVTSKRRRWWSHDYCQQCGYAKGPSPGDRCPECGYGWGCEGGSKSDAGTQPQA
jgi:hypothetical protein